MDAKPHQNKLCKEPSGIHIPSFELSSVTVSVTAPYMIGKSL